MERTSVTEEIFGTTAKGEQVKRFKLLNKKHDLEVEVISFGAALTSVKVADKTGQHRDVCMGFDDLKGYEGVRCIPYTNPYLGAICGRVVNRIGNASFTHDGVEYKLSANDGIHHIHGGFNSWSMAVWKCRIEGSSVVFSHTSKDGEEGYPGTVNADVTYDITDAGELRIQYKATSDKVTPIDMTSHGDYNLAGEGSGNIHDHIVTIYADRYVEYPPDPPLIPTGNILKVANTPFDLRKPTRVGDAVKNVSLGGYMHNFCLNGPTGRRKAARMSHPDSGIVMEVDTNQNVIVFYTCDFLNVTGAKAGHSYGKHSGFCLQSKGYEDAVNHENFPDPFLRPGSEYHHTVWHKFGVEG